MEENGRFEMTFLISFFGYKVDGPQSGSSRESGRFGQKLVRMNDKSFASHWTVFWAKVDGHAHKHYTIQRSQKDKRSVVKC